MGGAGADYTNVELYVDADFASNDLEERKSTTGYVVYMGGSLVEWFSKKQELCASSTTYAEYIAIHTALSSVIHIKEMGEELDLQLKLPITMWEDNKQAIAWATTEMINGRNKAVEVKYHRIRHYAREKWVKLTYLETSSMVADAFTKAVTGPVLKRHCVKMRIGV